MCTCVCARAHRTRRNHDFREHRLETIEILNGGSLASVFSPAFSCLSLVGGGVYWYGLMKTKIKRWKRGMPEMDTGDNRRGRLFWGGLLVENRLLDRRWSEFQPLGVAVALWWLLLMLDVARRWVWCMMYDGESWCLERIRYYLC